MRVRFISIIVILSLTLASIFLHVVKCAKIQANGGYDLVFAISNGTVEPQNVNDFLENIQNNLKNFSTSLHVATKGRFFVNSVDLILPYHWEFWDPTQFGLGKDQKITATWQNYEKADVRLSSDVVEPHVENPNVCGLPGNFVQLPLGFFQGDEKFGPPHKALLNAFARYRWGTHEEFGYPGDRRFPYFYKESLDDPLWKAVGCSNGNVTGEYLQPQNSSCVLDDELYPPSSDCRFIPEIDDENEDKPTSSISNFPWLDSIVEFCDESTHNFDAPTKQNIYCGYRSIQQVLENSPDYLGSSVTKSSRSDNDVDAEPPETTISIKVATKHPVFYLLVDSGRFNIPEEFMDKILTEVKTLLEDVKMTDVISSAGIFNSKEMGVKQIVDWSKMGDKLEEFKSVIDKFKSQTDISGNFALALEQVITMIRVHGHTEGAIILVLKHGASSRDFGKSAYESDLIALLRQEKINLHAIEIEVSGVNPQVHLKRLAEQSGGFHTNVSSRTDDISRTVRMARRKIEENLEHVTHDKLTGNLFKGFLPSPGVNFAVPFHQASLPVDTQIKFSLTLTNSQIVLDTKSKLINLVDGPENSPTLTMDSVGFEWDEKLNGGNRKTLKYTMKMPRNNFPFAWNFTYNGCIPSQSEDEDATCSSAFLLISYSLPSDTIQIPGSNLQVFVWTSPPQLDESSQLPLSTLSMPLTIFAQVHEDPQC